MDIVSRSLIISHSFVLTPPPNYLGHFEEVVLTIFNYLNILRSSVFESYHFSEISTMSKVSFRFREKSQPHTFASLVAYNLSEPWPPEWILSAMIIREWDEELVRNTLRYLTPERGRVIVMAKEHDPLVVKPIGDLCWETEKWYGTEYYVRRLEDGFFERVRLFFSSQRYDKSQTVIG